MAKSSRNPSNPKEPADKTNLVQFIMESVEDIGARGAKPANHLPYLDMYSTNREVVVEAEMPGVRREDIEVTLYKNTLSIKALKYECFDESNINYICMERGFGRVFRTVEVPFPVNPDAIKATYQNGILKIVLPRVEEKRGKPKKIGVETS